MVSIKEIAEKAKCHKSTVSRALRGEPGVNDNTRKRILKVAGELKYRPNPAARNLAGRKTKTLGLIVPIKQGISYLSEFCAGVSDAAAEKSYSLLTCNTDLGGPEKTLELLNTMMVDGIVLLSGEITEFLKKNRNLVDERIKLVSCMSLLENCNCVLPDVERGAAIAVEYLIKCGHRKIAMISERKSAGYTRMKERAYRNTLRANKLEVNEKIIERGERSVAEAFEAGSRLIDSGEDFSSIFAVTDIAAIGAIKAIREKGLKVPDDISVIGFDNMEAVQPFADVPLTTVDPAKRDMGRKACEILIENIEKDEQFIRKVIAEPRLVIRKSVKEIKGGGNK